MSETVWTAEVETRLPREKTLLAFDLKVADTGRATLARVQGPLDLHHTPGFLARLKPLCGPSRRMVLDLRRTDYVDSEGVRGLLTLHGWLDGRQGELRLVLEPGGRVERTLKLLQLQDCFRMFDTPSDAWVGFR